MTNFVSNAMVGPVAPLCQRDKGDVSNRVKCAGAQGKEFVKAGLAAAALTAPIAAAGRFTTQTANSPITRALTNSPMQEKAEKIFEKVYNKTAEIVKNTNLKEKVQKIISALKNASPATKGGLITTAVLSAVAFPIAMLIGQKHTYNMGQIDQKYADKAEQEKTKDDEAEQKKPNKIPVVTLSAVSPLAGTIYAAKQKGQEE